MIIMFCPRHYFVVVVPSFLLNRGRLQHRNSPNLGGWHVQDPRRLVCVFYRTPPTRMCVVNFIRHSPASHCAKVHEVGSTNQCIVLVLAKPLRFIDITKPPVLPHLLNHVPNHIHDLYEPKAVSEVGKLLHASSSATSG